MNVILQYLGVMLSGAVTTVELLLVGGGLSLVLGLVLALLRLYSPKPIRALVGLYIELMRGLPPILQLFIIYFGFNQFGIYFSAFTAAVIWILSLGGGYAAEIFRAGIAGVATGQWEAAEALGMRPWTTLFRVILPQAVASMLPPLTNFLVVQLKNTTLVYFIGVPDIMYQARLGVGATSQPAPLYAAAAIIYIVMTLLITRFGGFLERRVAIYR